MAVLVAGARMSRLNAVMRLVTAIALLGAAGACASGGPKKPPTGTPEPDKFLFERGTENLDKRRWTRRARVLPPARRQLSAEPVSRRRQARAGRHLPGRRQRRIVRPGDQRVPRVPQLLSDAQARPLRAVQAGDGALLPDAGARCATRPRRATRSASCRPTSRDFPTRRSSTRREKGCARRRTASTTGSIGVGDHYFRSSGIPARSAG